MTFVQIIEGRTDKMDELQKLDEEWFAATEGKRTLTRSVVGRDRNDPEHFVVLAFFDSYESAMKNSNLPETSDFAERQTKLMKEPPTFIDLEIIDDRS
jgi:quinol monooxygenase YgiN